MYIDELLHKLDNANNEILTLEVEKQHLKDDVEHIAKERDDELAFLYIIDLRFLDKTAAPIMVDVENELAQLGNFLLLVAKLIAPHDHHSLGAVGGRRITLVDVCVGHRI